MDTGAASLPPPPQLPLAAAQLSLGFKDPRVNLRITDGIKWVTDAEEGTYDAIIVDSSDPVGPAEVLFEEVQAPQMCTGAGSAVAWVLPGVLCLKIGKCTGHRAAGD